MTARLDYRWHLRKVMADRGMFSTTDLIGPLAQRGITLSSSQVYRLVTERPERLSLKILMALLDILDCTMDDLIEPVAASPARRTGKAPVPPGRCPPSTSTAGTQTRPPHRSSPGS
jgi:DNA-binding Xre family transcriptional regulator